MKQLPLSLYTSLTNSGSSEPAATTIGMCINDAVDLIIFKTFNPDILGCDKSKKMRSGIPTLAYLPSRRTNMSASSPSVTQCKPLVNPATLKASTVSAVSAGLLCTIKTSSCRSTLTGAVSVGFEVLDIDSNTFFLSGKGDNSASSPLSDAYSMDPKSEFCWGL